MRRPTRAWLARGSYRVNLPSWKEQVGIVGNVMLSRGVHAGLGEGRAHYRSGVIGLPPRHGGPVLVGARRRTGRARTTYEFDKRGRAYRIPADENSDA